MKQAIKSLQDAWNEIVESGGMTREEMATSLKDQISGRNDMSADELTDDRATEMRWDINSLTDAQLSQWERIVNRAAKAWLRVNQ